MQKGLEKKREIIYNIRDYVLHAVNRFEKKEDVSMSSENQSIDVREQEDAKKLLKEVYDILSEKGYNPITQIVGYLLSEDPTYITNCNNARALIRRVDRDVLMCELVKSYLEVE